MSRAAIDLATFREGRRTYLGGTDMAAILGVSSWSSPLDVYLNKVDPEHEDDSDSLPMRRGLWLEQFIADEFVRARPEFVTFKPRPIVRGDWGFPAGASIDRMVARVEKPRTPVAGLEAKAALSYVSGKQWKAPDPAKGIAAGDLPDAYYVQVQHYLLVSGLPLFYGVADTGADKLTIVPIEPDQRIHKRIIEAGRAFWQNHVEKAIPPEPDGSQSSADALGRMFPGGIPDPPLYIEDAEAEGILSDYLAHKVKAEEHKREADKAKQRLQMLMGDHESAVVGSWRLGWKRYEQTRLDSKRLKAELPEVAAKYAKTSESRRFSTPEEITE